MERSKFREENGSEGVDLHVFAVDSFMVVSDELGFVWVIIPYLCETLLNLQLLDQDNYKIVLKINSLIKRLFRTCFELLIEWKSRLIVVYSSCWIEWSSPSTLSENLDHLYIHNLFLSQNPRKPQDNHDQIHTRPKPTRQDPTIQMVCPMEDEEKVKIRGEVHRLVATRDQKYQSNSSNSGLLKVGLEIDAFFGNVCELDLVFQFHRVYSILDEVFLAGEIEETSKSVILDRLDYLEKLD
ncbi:hypothetical protein H4Q26_010247 [Puccinia striiformis f. sp. tritici PST-130]|nr:hypothetical protein H4Q26_010247 [Puccinia striiformis f. sp. tritici PST-130]